MMDIILTDDMFTNNKALVKYGQNQEALFTIVDETFQGDGSVGRVNRIVILTRTLLDNGEVTNAQLQSGVVGMGNGIVGVLSDVYALRGKILNHEIMSNCIIRLYEDT
jgi:hypothetical protein